MSVENFSLCVACISMASTFGVCVCVYFRHHITFLSYLNFIGVYSSYVELKWNSMQKTYVEWSFLCNLWLIQLDQEARRKNSMRGVVWLCVKVQQKRKHEFDVIFTIYYFCSLNVQQWTPMFFKCLREECVWTAHTWPSTNAKSCVFLPKKNINIIWITIDVWLTERESSSKLSWSLRTRPFLQNDLGAQILPCSLHGVL